MHAGFEYSRSQNPTRLALERLLASLEKADALLAAAGPPTGDDGPGALAVSSGSAATATVISGLGGLAGHIVCVTDVYGGTNRFLTQVAKVQQGIETSFIDLSYQIVGQEAETRLGEKEERALCQREDDELLGRIKAVLRPETKAIWIETPTNPTLRLVPIALIAAFAKERQIPLIVDNTFSSSYYANPLLLGASVVIHSITKYLNGHSDVVGGAIITADRALLERFRFLQNAHGAIPSPFDCWLTIRGIKTLVLRAREAGTSSGSSTTHSDFAGLNALRIATHLDREARPASLVRTVFYPGLRRLVETRLQRRSRELAWSQLTSESREWMTALGYSRDGPQGFPCSGMISFHIQSDASESALQVESGVAEKFLERLELFALAESLGGVESLAELPLKMTVRPVSSLTSY